MTFYDTVKKSSSGSSYIIIPKKYAKFNSIEYGDFVSVELKKQDIPKIEVKDDKQ